MSIHSVVAFSHLPSPYRPLAFEKFISPVDERISLCFRGFPQSAQSNSELVP